MISKYDLPDEIVLPCGAVLLPVIGHTLAGKPFPTAGLSTVAEAKRRKLKFRRVSVLSRNLRGKLDLYGRPYTGNVWIFVEVKP